MQKPEVTLTLIGGPTVRLGLRLGVLRNPEAE